MNSGNNSKTTKKYLLNDVKLRLYTDIRKSVRERPQYKPGGTNP